MIPSEMSFYHAALQTSLRPRGRKLYTDALNIRDRDRRGESQSFEFCVSFHPLIHIHIFRSEGKHRPLGLIPTCSPSRGWSPNLDNTQQLIFLYIQERTKNTFSYVLESYSLSQDVVNLFSLASTASDDNENVLLTNGKSTVMCLDM